MPKTPRGKRVPDSASESFHVVNKAPNGQAEPFFDRTREVWVAPWRKPDGKVGRPTRKTRSASTQPAAVKSSTKPSRCSSENRTLRPIRIGVSFPASISK